MPLLSAFYIRFPKVSLQNFSFIFYYTMFACALAHIQFSSWHNELMCQHFTMIVSINCSQMLVSFRVFWYDGNIVVCGLWEDFGVKRIVDGVLWRVWGKI